MRNRPGEGRAGGQGRATDPARLTTELLWTAVPSRSSPAAHLSATLNVRRLVYSDLEMRLRVSGSGRSGTAGALGQLGECGIFVDDRGVGATSAPVEARAFQVRDELVSGWGR